MMLVLDTVSVEGGSSGLGGRGREALHRVLMGVHLALEVLMNSVDLTSKERRQKEGKEVIFESGVCHMDETYWWVG